MNTKPDDQKQRVYHPRLTFVLLGFTKPVRLPGPSSEASPAWDRAITGGQSL